MRRRGRPPDPNRTRPVALRACKRHGLVEFGNYRAGGGKTRWMCKSCVAEAVTRRHQKVKRILVSEWGGACAICGYDRSMASLHFHHVDPTTKSFAVNMAHGKSLEAFRAEARKCVLVCANCHGEIEAGLTPSPPAMAKYGEEWTSIEVVEVDPIEATPPRDEHPRLFP